VGDRVAGPRMCRADRIGRVGDARLMALATAASERRFKDFHLTAKARICPWLSHMRHIRSTSVCLILSHHSRFTCECNKEDINDDNDDDGLKKACLSAGRCKATWKREFKLPWREAGPPNHHDDKVVPDQ